MIRTGVIAVIVTDTNSVQQVQAELTKYSNIIVGRMGVPDKTDGHNVIALIVKGTVERISALTGALGRLNGVQAKSVLSKE